MYSPVSVSMTEEQDDTLLSYKLGKEQKWNASRVLRCAVRKQIRSWIICKGANPLNLRTQVGVLTQSLGTHLNESELSITVSILQNLGVRAWRSRIRGTFDLDLTGL